MTWIMDERKMSTKYDFNPLIDRICTVIYNYHATFLVNNKNE
jgi:hypothetical protein